MVNMAFLRDQEQARVRDAVRRAESATSGQFVTVIASAAEGYRFIPTLTAAVVALTVPGIGLIVGLGFEKLYALQVAVFVGLLVAFLWMPLRVKLIPESVKLRRASRLAREQFMTLGLHRTPNRAGVLFFVSVAENYVEILADEGVAQVVDEGLWRQIVDDYLAAVRKGHLGEGMVTAIDRCTELMAKHFPPGESEENLLPDHLIQIAPG
jgi:putative membrane protein